MSLNLDGVLTGTDEKKINGSRHLADRRPIGLNFSDAKKPYATALRFWKSYKLATPLVWFILDSLGNEKSGAGETVKNLSGEEYAKLLLERLRS